MSAPEVELQVKTIFTVLPSQPETAFSPEGAEGAETELEDVEGVGVGVGVGVAVGVGVGVVEGVAEGEGDGLGFGLGLSGPLEGIGCWGGISVWAPAT